MSSILWNRSTEFCSKVLFCRYVLFYHLDTNTGEITANTISNEKSSLKLVYVKYAKSKYVFSSAYKSTSLSTSGRHGVFLQCCHFRLPHIYQKENKVHPVTLIPSVSASETLKLKREFLWKLKISHLWFGYKCRSRRELSQ